MNTRSIPANGTDLIAYLGTFNLKFYIMCITETWVNEKVKIINLLPFYICFRSSCLLRDGAGLLVLARQELNAPEILNKNHNSDVVECVFIKVADIEKKIAVGCCYRPPSINDSSCFFKCIIRNAT